MRKKVFLSLLVVLFSFMLAGCKSEVALYYFQGSETSSYRLDFRFDNDELDALNSSAKTDKGAAVHSDYYLSDFLDKGNESWTVKDYLSALLKYTTYFVYTATEDAHERNMTVYIFQTINGVPNEYDDIKTTTTRTDERGIFFNYYNFEQINPMTKYKTEYDNAKGSGTPMSAIYIFQNGWQEKRPIDDPILAKELEAEGWKRMESGSNLFVRKLMPAFSEAFPIAKTLSPDNLKLNYFMPNSNKLITSGEMFSDNEGNKFYLFKEIFATADATILYEMRRANSISWNFLAVMIGFATVGVVYFISKKRTVQKKPKRTNSIADFGDRLPYDPNATNSNNPFEGY